MTPEKLEINVSLQIQKPISEVFEAIVNPEKMSNYFIAEGSARLEQGQEVMWKFPEFEDKFPIKVGRIEKDKYISYLWGANDEETVVEMTLMTKENDSTLVTITEKNRNNDEEGIKWLMGNSFGWSNFLACLKAYLEYGINLRKGAFDYMRK